MRLDFNVLWIEDQVERVEAQKERIDRALRKEGFRLDVLFKTSVEAAVPILASDIYGDNIDLILIDYDLGGDTMGDRGLVEVRSRFRYKDIIFYSAQVTNLIDIVKSENINGVFCCSRDQLTDTVEGVFETLVKKVIDIDHSRGIVMGGTSDIDWHVFRILSKIFEECDDAKKSESLQALQRSVALKKKQFDKDIRKLEAVTAFRELEELFRIYSSYDRLDLLLKVLEIVNVHQNEAKMLEMYKNKLIPDRNMLAHTRVKKSQGFTRKLIDKKGDEITAERMRVIRTRLLEHQEGFDRIVKALGCEED
jgi:hypothetical protein